MKDGVVSARHMGAKVSPKKVVPVMDLIRGKSVLKAKQILAFDRTKPAAMILKVLKSAEANAINNDKLDKNKLFIKEVWVGAGTMMKRMSPGAKGRADPILKRSSHIYINLWEVK
jgi:large subunit ribosomal protein L22